MYVTNWFSRVECNPILADLRDDWECRDMGYDPVYGLWEDLTFGGSEELSPMATHALKVVTRVLALRDQLDN